MNSQTDQHPHSLHCAVRADKITRSACAPYQRQVRHVRQDVGDIRLASLRERDVITIHASQPIIGQSGKFCLHLCLREGQLPLAKRNGLGLARLLCHCDSHFLSIVTVVYSDNMMLAYAIAFVKTVAYCELSQ